MVADILQLTVNMFKRVSEILDLLLQYAEQNIQRFFHLHPATAGTHAHQAEVGNLGITQADQTIRLQDQCYRRGTVTAFAVMQKQGVNMNALLVSKIAGRCLDFLDIVGIRQRCGINGFQQCPLCVVLRSIQRAAPSPPGRSIAEGSSTSAPWRISKVCNMRTPETVAGVTITEAAE